jgi:voltage-gated potassium channel
MAKAGNAQVLAWEKKTERYLLVLSLMFLVFLVLPVAHPISKVADDRLNIINYVIWLVFVLDFVYKFAIADAKKAFIKGHLFELLIIAVPFIRPLRLLRLIPVIGAFLKYSSKTMAGRMLQHASLIAVMLGSVSAVMIYQIEKNQPGSNIHNLGDAIWWAASTTATFGAGSLTPVSAVGKAISFVLMLGSIAYAGVLTASVASWFVQSDETKQHSEQLELILRKLEAIEANSKKTTRKKAN